MRILTLILISLFSINSLCWSQNEGDNLFNPEQVHIVEITLSMSNWWDTLSYIKEYSDTTDTTLYIPGNVVIDGTPLDSVGIRFKGHSSYYYNPSLKRSFKLDFNKYIQSQNYDGLKKISLSGGFEDPTMMREKLYLDILNNHALYAPRCTYTKLYINGTYWGLYYIIEQIDKTFLNDRFDNNQGNLFRGDNKIYLTLYDAACADLNYHIDIQDYYNCYELKTNKTANDWSDLIHLTDIISNTPDSLFRDSLETVLNAPSFLGAWAAGNLLMNTDAYWKYPTNYFVYYNISTSLFEWTTWDASRSFGILPTVSSYPFWTNLDLFYIWPNIQTHPLTVKMIVGEYYKEIYTDFICKIIKQDFNPDSLFPKIDNLADLIRTDLYADTNKLFTNQQFEDNIDSIAVPNVWGGAYTSFGLKSFISDRHISVLAQLDVLGCPNLVTANYLVSPFNKTNIYPNPFSNFAILEFENSKQEKHTLTLYNSLGQLVRQIDNINEEQVKIEKKNLTSGLYFFQLRNEVETVGTGKIIIE